MKRILGAPRREPERTPPVRPSVEPERPSELSDLANMARQVSLTLFGSMVSATFGFALTLVITRGLGAEGAGLFFVTLAVWSVAAHALTLGADIGVVRTIARYLALGEPGSVRTVITAGLLPVTIVSSAVAAALYVLAPSIAPPLADDSSSAEIVSLFRAFVIFIPFGAVSAVVLAATRGFGTMTPYTLTEQLGKPFVRPFSVGLVIAGGLSTQWVGVAWAVPIVIGLAYGSFALARLHDRLPPGYAPSRLFDRDTWSEFWRFASVRGIAAALQILIRWLDVILVGAIASASAAGIYAAVTRLVIVGGIVQRAIILAMGPRFSALLAVDDRSRAQVLYQTATTWLIAMSFPFYLLLAVFAPTVVLVFGDQFSSGATPMSILALAMLINMATGPVTTILLMAGKATWNLGNAIGALAVNATLNVALIPPFGIKGAAVAWAATVLVENLLPTVQIQRALGLQPIGRGALVLGGAAALICGLAGGVIQWTTSLSVVGVVSVALALLAVYAVVTWRFRRLLATDALRESLRFRARKRV